VRKKRKPTKQTRATKKNTNDPLASPNALELNWDFERIDHLNCVFGVEFVALVLNAMC
jgi:hypothetical protein